LKGPNGVAVCSQIDGNLTSLHPSWEQKYKRELGVIEPPAAKPSLLGRLDDAKQEAKAFNEKSALNSNRDSKKELD
jgi:hypothetical protein